MITEYNTFLLLLFPEGRGESLRDRTLEYMGLWPHPACSCGIPSLWPFLDGHLLGCGPIYACTWNVLLEVFFRLLTFL